MKLYLSIFLGAFAGLASAGNQPRWEPLQDDPVPVACTEIDGKPWCRSEGIVHAPTSRVVQALRDMENNADKFESVVRIDVVPDAVAERVLRVVLDYPAPLSDRDYVAEYSYRKEGAFHVFSWVPASAKFPPVKDVVRLPNFAGEWRLRSVGDKTWVRYTWQAEINGSFPSFGYKVAWKRAGHEALRDLARTQNAELSRQ